MFAPEELEVIEFILNLPPEQREAFYTSVLAESQRLLGEDPTASDG